MGTLFMIIAVILLFLGLPASIILTIIAFIKKNISSIFKFSIPIVIGGIVFFLVLGAILLPDTEVKNQELVKTEQQETTSLILNSEEVFCIDMKYVKLIEE